MDKPNSKIVDPSPKQQQPNLAELSNEIEQSQNLVDAIMNKCNDYMVNEEYELAHEE